MNDLRNIRVALIEKALDSVAADKVLPLVQSWMDFIEGGAIKKPTKISHKKTHAAEASQKAMAQRQHKHGMLRYSEDELNELGNFLLKSKNPKQAARAASKKFGRSIRGIRQVISKGYLKDFGIEFNREVDKNTNDSIIRAVGKTK